MSDITNIRLERVERLLDELRYEMTRGIMEHDLPEEINFGFMLPSKVSGKVVVCRLQCAVESQGWPPLHNQSNKLQLVKP